MQDVRGRVVDNEESTKSTKRRTQSVINGQNMDVVVSTYRTEGDSPVRQNAQQDNKEMNNDKEMRVVFESDEMFFKTVSSNKHQQYQNTVFDRMKLSHLKTFMNKENLDLYKSVTKGFYSS